MASKRDRLVLHVKHGPDFHRHRYQHHNARALEYRFNLYIGRHNIRGQMGGEPTTPGLQVRLVVFQVDGKKHPMLGLGPLMYGCLPAERHQSDTWGPCFQDMNGACGHLTLVGAPEKNRENPADCFSFSF